MNTAKYGNEFEEGFSKTVRFLTSHGVDREAAEETAQAAWTRPEPPIATA
jgi:hypothetical protein